MNEVCAALRFSLGCDANWLVGTFRTGPELLQSVCLYDSSL
jgi:hypothetical protein